MAKKKKTVVKVNVATPKKPVVRAQSVDNATVYNCKHRNEKGYCTWLDNKCNPRSMKCAHQKMSHISTVMPSVSSAKKQLDRVVYRSSRTYNPFSVEYYGVNSEVGTINKIREIPTLYVFKGFLRVDKKCTIDYKMLIRDIQTKKENTVLVAYNTKTNKYYISDRQLKYLHKNKCYPCATFFPTNEGSIPMDTYNFNDFSILSLYGYCVGKTGLKTEDRRQILRHILDTKVLSGHEIISHLQGLISLRKKRTDVDFSQAIKDWNEDIDFVNNYSFKKLKKRDNAIWWK